VNEAPEEAYERVHHGVYACPLGDEQFFRSHNRDMYLRTHGHVAGAAEGNAATGSAAADGGIPQWTCDTGSENGDGDAGQDGNETRERE